MRILRHTAGLSRGLISNGTYGWRGWDNSLFDWKADGITQATIQVQIRDLAAISKFVLWKGGISSQVTGKFSAAGQLNFENTKISSSENGNHRKRNSISYTDRGPGCFISRYYITWCPHSSPWRSVMSIICISSMRQQSCGEVKDHSNSGAEHTVSGHATSPTSWMTDPVEQNCRGLCWSVHATVSFTLNVQKQSHI